MIEQRTPVWVVVIDDCRLYREAVAELLARQPWVDRVDTAPNGQNAVRRALCSPPRIMLLNVAAEESLACLRTWCRPMLAW